MNSRRVPLRVYTSFSLAEDDCFFLREQGSEATGCEASAPLAGGGHVTIAGRLCVEVECEQREPALAALERRRRAREAHEEDWQLRCPRCASEDIGSYHPFAIWILLPLMLPFLIVALVMIPFIPFVMRGIPRKRHYCASCGNRWSFPRKQKG
jgi:hypothetical protein